MIHFDDYNLQMIEREIRHYYVRKEYKQVECLLRVRKEMLNELAMSHQKELLPDIIAFNEALHDALKHMYDRAHELYRQISAIQPDIQLIAKCYLAYDYPALHPYQKEDRQDLFDAICDFGWNKLYESGVTSEFELPRDINITFDSIRGMDCTPFNWNEGLDPELTKDLHINRAFHNLFDHTKFALTDFVFCRDFNVEININFEEPV